MLSSPAQEMTRWQRWVERPQSVWIRRAFAQVHLWIGAAAAVYVVMISISGSAIVFRRELNKAASRQVFVAAVGARLSSEGLQQSAQRAYPGYEVYSVRFSENPRRPAEAILGDGRMRISRFFNPYNGADLGDPQPVLIRVLGCLADLHDNLLAGRTGRFANGIGAALLTLLALTGIVIWWPGIRNWRRSLMVTRNSRFARFNWDLHSATGFWASAFVFIWGLSGMCLCFPGVLDPILSSSGVRWVTRLHFGRFGIITEAIWTLLGLAPGLLAATGVLMWWNRVLRKKLARDPG